MATHAALAVSRIPAKPRLQSKSAIHAFPAQCSSKVPCPCTCLLNSVSRFVYLFPLLLTAQRLQVAEFSGLRASKNGGDASFFDAIAVQITPKVID